MKISILLPYKENFSPDYPGAVSCLFMKHPKLVSIKKILLFMAILNIRKNLS